MAKVFGMHMIALKPGVKAGDFENFIQQAVRSAPPIEGLKNYLLKGDRGDREGKYLWMMEIESVEARDRLFPSAGELSEEAQQFHAALAAILEKWATFATLPDIISTDYVVVSE